MKKLLTILLIIAISISLYSCDNLQSNQSVNAEDVINIETFYTGFQQLQDTSNTQQIEIDSLNLTITNLNTEIQTLNNDVETLKTENSTLREDILINQQNIEELESIIEDKTIVVDNGSIINVIDDTQINENTEYIIHAVKQNQTLWEIAIIYYNNGTKYTNILLANHIQNETISEGMELKIPKTIDFCYEETINIEDSLVETEYLIHPVLKNQTIYDIAESYYNDKNKYQLILDANNLKINDIKEDMNIKIPILLN